MKQALGTGVGETRINKPWLLHLKSTVLNYRVRNEGYLGKQSKSFKDGFLGLPWWRSG